MIVEPRRAVNGGNMAGGGRVEAGSKVKRQTQVRYLGWSEVLHIHKTLRGIGPISLLVDRGESGYRNQFLLDGQILYQGEGLKGNQQPTKGNRILLEALSSQQPFQVFCREATNHWTDLGPYRAVSVEYLLLPSENRHIYWFCLKPA